VFCTKGSSAEVTNNVRFTTAQDFVSGTKKQSRHTVRTRGIRLGTDMKFADRSGRHHFHQERRGRCRRRREIRKRMKEDASTFKITLTRSDEGSSVNRFPSSNDVVITTNTITWTSKLIRGNTGSSPAKNQTSDLFSSKKKQKASLHARSEKKTMSVNVFPKEQARSKGGTKHHDSQDFQEEKVEGLVEKERAGEYFQGEPLEGGERKENLKEAKNSLGKEESRVKGGC